MNVLVNLEHHFCRAPDGTVWTPTQLRYSFFTRYLEVFDQVVAVARVREIDRIPNGWQRADGPGVSFLPIPCYRGPVQYAARANQVKQAITRAVHAADAAILRAPSIIARTAERALRKQRRPYGLEIVSDPSDVFARGVIDHPLRPLLRLYFSHQLKRQCRDACAAAYVTKETLQRRYPPGPGVFHAFYSDVELDDEAFASAQIRGDYMQKPFTLITVASLAQLYKAPDVLLHAFKRCLQNGLDLKLVLIGDGQYRMKLERLSVDLRVSERVCFLGQLPAGQAIRDQLDQAHLFVLPSRTEGLPRAMIEAMARGLPCIGSAVGGIPELLQKEELVPAGDAMALAEKIKEVVGDPQRLAAMARRNLAVSRQYHEALLRKPRMRFYEYIRAKAAERMTCRRMPDS